MNYYNDFEPYVCKWLSNLAQADRIPAGFVDSRSIKEVTPDDVRNYTQAHFFAGIGTWAYALRLAGWPDARPVWTGSCPCQPFSAAGKRGSTDDVRHLWPEWFRLIRECRPPVVFGEQVASSDGLDWLDIVSADLESEGYAVAAFDLCAAGIGAPHLRQRLYFVAHTPSFRLEGNGNQKHATGYEQGRSCQSTGESSSDRLAHADGEQADAATAGGLHPYPGERGELGDASRKGLPIRQCEELPGEKQQQEGRTVEQPGNSFWTPLEWLPCRDGKYRPTKPGLFPLAHGTPRRVAKLRAIGNAIVAPLAAEFIRAYLDLEGGIANG